MSSRILALPLSQDEETQILAKGYEAVALLDKAKLFDELIPAIQRVGRQSGQQPAAPGDTSSARVTACVRT
jgi:hypothetical protein